MKIIGTGSAIPSKVVTNDMLSEFLDTSDEWIVPRTGIRSRHVISSEELEDLGTEACRKALDMSGLGPQDIDYFICSNVVNEYATPGLSCVIGAGLGLQCPCIDINCACPGFIYAMDIAEAQYRAGRVKNVLIVCCEEPTRMCDWTDRSTCVLFGDGGAAAVLGEGNDLLSINLTATGNDAAIRIPHGTNSSPFYEHEEERAVLHMAGNEVYKFATAAMANGIKKAVEDAGLQQSDIDCVIPHQANIRIINTAEKNLDIPREKFFCNVQHYGNTSSASVVIALDEANRGGVLKKGDLVAMCAFGGGLTTGSCIIRWNK